MEPVLITGGAGAGISAWGPVVFTGIMWAACGFAMAEALSMARNPDCRESFSRHIKGAFGWAVLLGVAQLVCIAVALIFPSLRTFGQFAGMYLFFVLLLPVLWAVGKVRAEQAGFPRKANSWPLRRRGVIFCAMVVMGAGLSVFLVALVPVSAGRTVTSMADGASNLTLGVLALWLMVNAPWQEELLFRHYLVARIATVGAGGKSSGRLWTVVAVVAAAAVFAVGHSGHMEPAWPKLVQTFSWGLMLGWARVEMGTGYAIGLHLAWNLCAPLAAPFVNS